ncbi:YeiH family protein [Pseudactinotalea terrae]|uniref:YeiH family protein n=1 Tax=Pseudactinotalea terrae TaxID=1743262 RepID=UPI001390802E|nr:putative sulfate exporter family transporter [Pseudactinotalea terrae]
MLNRLSQEERLATLAIGAALPVLVALAAMATSALAPLVSALLVALVIGTLTANLAPRRRLPEGQQRTDGLQRAEQVAKHLLRLGIVLLGLQMSLTDLAAIGWRGVALVLATVAATFVVTASLGRRLGLDAGLSTLIAAGFSICGAAAIAAISQTVPTKSRDVGLAVTLVTIFGTAMIVVVPWLAHVLGLGEQEAAMWAGASIHEVAQVVAAGSLLGGGALATATTVKLARVVMVAPVTAIVKRQHGAGEGASVPWFVTGFLSAVALRTVVDISPQILDVAGPAATLFLAAGMFGMGLAIRLRDLWPLPVRAFGLAAIATVVAAAVPLTMLLLT